MHGARRAVHLSRVDLASLDVAKPMWHEYQRLLVEEQPFMFLFQPGATGRREHAHPGRRHGHTGRMGECEGLVDSI
jgi:hypothetical protein